MIFICRNIGLYLQLLPNLYNKDKPCDILTLTDYLSNLKILETAGGESYIYEIANATPSVANIKAYAQIVKERSVYKKNTNSSYLI
jgi:replicative DNA helicase